MNYFCNQKKYFKGFMWCIFPGPPYIWSSQNVLWFPPSGHPFLWRIHKNSLFIVYKTYKVFTEARLCRRFCCVVTVLCTWPIFLTIPSALKRPEFDTCVLLFSIKYLRIEMCSGNWTIIARFYLFIKLSEILRDKESLQMQEAQRR